jgi:hypothetical protein
VNGSGSGSCPVAGFGIRGVEHPGESSSYDLQTASSVCVDSYQQQTGRQPDVTLFRMEQLRDVSLRFRACRLGK